MSLTFSVRNNPGKYALLLGSGVSTEAGMPTGWDIVEDLISQMASSEDESLEEDDTPAEWYRERYDENPTYERVIQRLGITQDDRKALLEGYFEPSAEEMERGLKTPTDAHHSIAWLVDHGYISVILTTNFDQLLEDALRDRGIRPVIVTGEASARGAEPLDHQDAIVVKVNGDYTETTIKNLSSELDAYPAPLQSIIDRTFRDYGLIVCGWSGKHDTRLRESLLSSGTHRYATYWTYYSELKDVAERIVSHRDGIAFQTDGAASFFSDLKDRLQGLEDTASGEPLSTDVARERVKRYLPRAEQRIALADFIRETAQETKRRVHDETRFPVARSEVDEGMTTRDRTNAYNPASRTLLAEVATIGYWGGESTNSGIDSVLTAISIVSPSTGPQVTPYYTELLQLRRYPATVLIYGAGVPSVARDNWDLIGAMLSHEFRTYATQARDGRTGTAMKLFHSWSVTDRWGKGLDRESADNAVREGAKAGVKDVGMDFFTSDAAFDDAFERFEVIFDLALLNQLGPDSVHFIEPTYWESAVDTMVEFIQRQDQEWPLVRDDVIATDIDEAEELLAALREKLH